MVLPQRRQILPLHPLRDLREQLDGGSRIALAEHEVRHLQPRGWLQVHLRGEQSANRGPQEQESAIHSRTQLHTYWILDCE